MTEPSLAGERRTSERRSFSSFTGVKVDRRCGFDRRTSSDGGEAALQGDERRLAERRCGQDRRVIAERRTSGSS